MTVKPKHCMVG